MAQRYYGHDGRRRNPPRRRRAAVKTNVRRRNMTRVFPKAMAEAGKVRDSGSHILYYNSRLDRKSGLGGELYHNGEVIARGAAGSGKGFMNPDLDRKRNIGPLPKGVYTVRDDYGYHLMAGGRIYANGVHLDPPKDPARRRAQMRATDGGLRYGFLIHGGVPGIGCVSFYGPADYDVSLERGNRTVRGRSNTDYEKLAAYMKQNRITHFVVFDSDKLPGGKFDPVEVWKSLGLKPSDAAPAPPAVPLPRPRPQTEVVAATPLLSRKAPNPPSAAGRAGKSPRSTEPAAAEPLLEKPSAGLPRGHVRGTGSPKEPRSSSAVAPQAKKSSGPGKSSKRTDYGGLFSEAVGIFSRLLRLDSVGKPFNGNLSTNSLQPASEAGAKNEPAAQGTSISGASNLEKTLSSTPKP